MAKKALCLSGGATRGSFQVGAIKCLYEVYGFRPDIITGTSVGAINGIKLACAPPPTVNDPEAILTAVNAGTVDPQLRHMRELEQFWLDANGRQYFFAVRAPFIGTLVEEALAENRPAGGTPIGTQIDLAAAGINIPFVQVIAGIAVADQLFKIKSLLQTVMVEDAVADLGPVEATMRRTGPRGPTVNAGMVGDPPPYTNNLYYGTPLLMAVLSLETGKLRYVTNRGVFVERDGRTPVATALTTEDIDAALDENLQPLSPSRSGRIKTAVSNYQAAVNQVAANHRELSDPNTRAPRKAELAAASQRQRDRGAYWAGAAATQLRDVRIAATVRDALRAPDPIRGAIASSSLPVLLLPQAIGAEHYIDAGLREIIPIDVILDRGVTEIVGILCSTIELPDGDAMKNVGLVEVGVRAATQITIAEVTQGDLVASAGSGIPTRIIAPTVDVHSGLDLVPSTVEIAMHYGWMRAADAMRPVADASERDEFARTSELITRLRMRCFELEQLLATDPIPSSVDARWRYFELRVNRWAIMHVAARRTVRALPPHPAQVSWSTSWERDFRAIGKMPAPTVWSDLQVREATRERIYTVDLWPASSPHQFSPDFGSLEDAGSDRIYWLVRGAIFEDRTRAALANPSANVVVPTGLHHHLPRVPDGAHLMAETQAPGTQFLVIGGCKYASPTSEWIAAAGLAGATPAIVPTGGLTQIPDGPGGVPSFLGSLQVVDDARQPVSRVRLERLQGSSTTADIRLRNRSDATITVIDIGLVGVGPAQGVSVVRTPTTMGPRSIDFFTLQLNPGAAGAFEGSITISSSDTVVGRITVDLILAVLPLGDGAELRLTPPGLAISAPVNSELSSAMVTVTNVGKRAPDKVTAWVEPPQASGLFPIGGPLVGPGGELRLAGLQPGSAVDVPVFFRPTAVGTYAAELIVQASGKTSLNNQYTQTARIPLTGEAGSSTLRLLTRTPQPADFEPPGLRGRRARTVPRTTVTIELGTVQPPVTQAVSVFILNLGTLTLEVPAIIGYYASPSVTQPFPIEIPAGGWAEVVLDFGLSFAPVAGRFSETMRVLSNDPITPEAQILITGTIAGAMGHLRPEYIDFGDVGVNTVVDRQTTFSNVGSIDLHVKGVSWTQGGQAFRLATPPPTLVPAGGSLTLDIEFGPVQAQGIYADYLVIDTAEGVTANLGTRATAT